VSEQEVFVTCAKGIAPVLAGEILALGFPVDVEDVSGVQTRADPAGQIRLCFELQTAHRVLVPVWKGRVPRLPALYRALVEFPWEEWLGPDGYVRLIGTVRREDIRDNRVALLKAKDAVMDRLRDHYGRRPDSGPGDHGATLYLYWVENELTVSVDLAGVPLSRRGYRQQGGEAPLQEALAAAMLLRSGWDRDTPLSVPMGGAGTLAIEAARMAVHKAPGLHRSFFGFQHLLPYTREMEDQERLRLEQQVRDTCPPIYYSDRDPEAFGRARANAELAGLECHIDFDVCEFTESRFEPGGWVILNPPYGLRLDHGEDLEPLYAGIGHWLKGLPPGGMAWVITGNLKLAKRFGLKLADRTTLYNGAVECRFLGFHLTSPGARP
jgi:putative N6-adenine-specific DNA methylase